MCVLLLCPRDSDEDYDQYSNDDDYYFDNYPLCVSKLTLNACNGKHFVVFFKIVAMLYSW